MGAQRRNSFVIRDAAACERSFEAMRIRHEFVVCGYVVMPEEVYLLVSEPRTERLSPSAPVQRLDRCGVWRVSRTIRQSARVAANEGIKASQECQNELDNVLHG